MSATRRPVIFPFPTPPVPEVAGVLPFGGRDTIAIVSAEGGGQLVLMDWDTGWRVTLDLSTAVAAMSEKAKRAALPEGGGS